jgi:hypothetical protein
VRDDNGQRRRKNDGREPTREQSSYGSTAWEWDGRFTVTITDAAGDSASFRTLPEYARLIVAAPDLLAALKRAVEAIRSFHGIGLSGKAEEGMWQLYQASPEMTAINAAIAKAEGR